MTSSPGLAGLKHFTTICMYLLAPITERKKTVCFVSSSVIPLATKSYMAQMFDV